MTTKTKIKDSLKNVFINELKDKKEEERLERVEANSKLKKSTIYIDGNKQNQNYVDFLESEGIPLVIKNTTENAEEWKTVTLTTNMHNLPTVLVNDTYLVNQRDFTNAKQLAGYIQYLADSNVINPTFENRLIEKLKTDNYNLWTKLNNIEQKLHPITTFISNLQKELAEEEKGE